MRPKGTVALTTILGTLVAVPYDNAHREHGVVLQFGWTDR